MAIRNLIIVLMSAAVAFACYSITAKQRYSNLFAEALTKIDKFSLQAVSERQLFESAMMGMLSSLDENSTYLTGDDYQAMEQRLRQEFGGVGMYVDVNPKTKDLTVTSPIPDSPAFRSGIRSGDIIAKINGLPAQGLDRSEAIKRMRGPVGEKLVLSILQNPDESPREVGIIREVIPTHSVVGDVRKADGSWNYFLPEDSRIAFVNVIEFSERTDRELADLFEKIGPQTQALILDLRTNGGGLLSQAVRVSDMFLGNGEEIVEIRGRDNRLVQPAIIADAAKALDAHIPLAILVDRFTASASEIVAACLQDQRRAVIIGERSYGKGTVQDLIPLERGRSSIKITTATYWRPSGRNIDKDNDKSGQQWGVQPDPGFQVELSEDAFFQVAMLRYRRQYKVLDIFDRGTLDQSRKPESSEVPADQKPNPSEKLDSDPVLLRAIEHLRQVLDGKHST